MAEVYPFTAVVGQERMKRALVLNAVNPRLGGVLIRGQKGTAKSTVVRALAALLPDNEVADGCRFGCDPGAPAGVCPDCQRSPAAARVRRRPALETLPLGITEDRLIGTLDLEHALKTGEKRFEPGLLARVNRGILYVDEVNLLEDHIVDLLLDVAAMGTNRVEREGVSFQHPAEFVLVGTMNPEEGELRPQLLDRFGLCVDVAGVEDVAARVEIIARRLDYERDPAAFLEAHAEAERTLAAGVAQARQRLSRTRAPAWLFEAVARLSLRIGVDGHRADVLAVKAALTLAAIEGRDEAVAADLERAVELVYPHRIKRQPFEERTLDEGVLAAAVQEAVREAGAGAREEPPEKKALRRAR